MMEDKSANVNSVFVTEPAWHRPLSRRQAVRLLLLVGGAGTSMLAGLIACTPQPPKAEPTISLPLQPSQTELPDPTPTLVVEKPLEETPQAIRAVTEFVKAMQGVGISIAKEDLLQPGGLQVKDHAARDGKRYKIAYVHVDTDGLINDYPVMISTENGWEPAVVTELLRQEGVDFGLAYDLHDSPFRAKERRMLPAEEHDRVIAENARIVGANGIFYWSKVFWSSDTTRQDWRWVDEYLGFLRKSKLKDGAPIIIDRSDNYYHRWLLDLAAKSPRNEETKREFSQILTSSIKRIVSHSRGLVTSWTINEVFGSRGVWEKSIWERTIGPDYVLVAIKAIRDEDPNAKVVLNDYYLENDVAKNRAVYDLATDLLAQGVLRQGDVIGTQGHQSIFFLGTTEQIRDSLRPFIELGLTVRVTELDVFDVYSNDLATQNKKADAYLRYINAARQLNAQYWSKRKQPVVDAIIVWGTSESSSWHLEDPKFQGKRIYPLLIADEGNKEYAYYRLAQKIVASEQD